jgi:NAD-dependent dihydropyrimidine dehydrogenase PreA subunit
MNRAEIKKLVSALKNAELTVTVVPDLCKTAISHAEQMAEIATTTVIACYPRAVQSIFDGLGLKPKQVFDLRNHSSEQILGEMGISHPVFSPEHPFPEFSPENEQEAWHPVIDKERCTECGKCHDFCLFGVYSFKERTVKVAQPQNCKNNCPACARVCPSRAIIFPKYEKSPINGGLHYEEKFDETDTKALYNIALKHKLAERRAKVSLLKKN